MGWRLAQRFIVPAVAAGFAALYYVKTRDLPEEITTYPHLFVKVVLVLSAIVLLQDALLGTRSLRVSATANMQAEEQQASFLPGMVLIVASLLYLIVFPLLGFVASSALYLWLLVLYFGWGVRGVTLRVLVRVSVICAAVLASLDGLFRQWMQLPLP